MTPDGNWSAVRSVRGRLREYTRASDALELVFEFNPATMTRTRNITLRTGGAPGSRGGYDFRNETEAVRAAQGVTMAPETLTLKILLDATDRMNAGDPRAAQQGVQPEIDILRSMLEPKVQAPSGARTLAALQPGEGRAFARQEHASVLVLTWGVQVLPVFLTQAQVELKDFLPSLLPYRAEASLTLQVIESANPFYATEVRRQNASAGLN